MKDDKTFKVRDKIVHFGRLYRIFKIKKKKAKDKEEKIILFRPYFKNPRNRAVIRSIPINNIGQTDIRRPISKKELRQLLEELSKKSNRKKPVNLNQAKGLLGLNDVSETAQVLKNLWREKNDRSKNFSKSKENVLRISMRRLTEEIAFVGNISLGKARKKIKTALKEGNEK